MDGNKSEGSRRQTGLEEVLEFCVRLCRDMIASGANLERVQLAVARICSAYSLTDVSLYLLSTYVSLAARDRDGRYASRQCGIPSSGIHLQRLKQLNRLSYTVTAETPSPERLGALLEEAKRTKEYPDAVIMLARVGAMICLCVLFGGGVREAVTVAVVTAFLHLIMNLMARPGLDQVAVNAVVMFAASAAAFGMMAAGVSQNGAVIMITVSMLVIPGIPLVNAARNLLCGNEMNGVLQLLKAVIETLALALGMWLAMRLFGRSMEDVAVTAVTDPLLLLLLSFGSSFCFAVVFRIPGHDLIRASMGSVLTRIALLTLPAVISSRMICVTLAALAAALYAEVWATCRRDPSTYFVYPAIIPLIPGDLFYFMILGFYRGDHAMMTANGLNCLSTLIGMSIGFVLSSIIAHYIRRMRHAGLLRQARPKKNRAG